MDKNEFDKIFNDYYIETKFLNDIEQFSSENKPKLHDYDWKYSNESEMKEAMENGCYESKEHNFESKEDIRFCIGCGIQLCKKCWSENNNMCCDCNFEHSD